MLEGLKLERALVGLILLVIIAIGLPLYWLGEPTREPAPIGPSTTGRPRPASSCSSRPTPRCRHPRPTPSRSAAPPATAPRARAARPTTRSPRGREGTRSVAGAGAQHRAGPLHPRHGPRHHHLRALQHADAGVGRHRRWSHERPADLRPGGLSQDHPADPAQAKARPPSTAPTGPTLRRLLRPLPHQGLFLRPARSVRGRGLRPQPDRRAESASSPSR